MSTCCFPKLGSHTAQQRYSITYVLYKQYLRHVYIYIHDRKCNQITALIIYPRSGLKCTCVSSYFWTCKHERFIEEEIFKHTRFNFWSSIDWTSMSRILRNYILPYCKERRNKDCHNVCSAWQMSKQEKECAICLEPMDVSSMWNVKCKRCKFMIHDTCWTQWYQINQRMAIHCAICKEMLSVTNCHYDQFYNDYDFVLYSNTTTPSLVHNNVYATT